MTHDTEENKIIMTAGDVCTLLGIKESTLRKYALILDKAGYHFDSNSKGQRAYYDRDITVLRRFIDIKRSPDMTLEQTANAVMAWLEQSNISLPDTRKERYDDDIKELKEMVSSQNELLKTLTARMDQQQKFIEESLNKRDELLIQHLKESMESQKQIAAAHEEEKKKGFFSRLFGGQM